MIRKKGMEQVSLAAICIAALIAAAYLAGCLLFAEKAPEKKADDSYISTEYADKLFDDSYVHEIDIRIAPTSWEYMTLHATQEQYVVCDVLIDGELVENIAIRPKGNSSLSAIKARDSDRFSFKIEFDHYNPSHTYYGLDKLSLNNLGQDVSCMKDFLTYHMMNEAGIAAPLSSFVMVKLNGEDFGLYLAVEAIEDSFARRNYGENYGNIYKPECFAMENVTPKAFINTQAAPFTESYEDLGPGDRVDFLGTFIRQPFEACFGENMEVAALKYVGEDPARYSVMFDSAVFANSDEDKEAFIQAVKLLNEGADAAQCMDTESVLKYFMVHNFVNNYDSYTGVFVHNYYIREYEGKLSMIPWDYNLAFGIFTAESAVKSFMGEDSPYTVEWKVGEAMSDAKGWVNYPIDTPTITVDLSDRPLLAALLGNEKYLERYHELYAAFLEDFFQSGRFEELYTRTWESITPYLQSGQTFYTYEQAQNGAKAVHDYCVLRAESIEGQLAGTIPATMEGQRQEYENLVETGDLDLSASVTFDSLIFGIRSEDIIEILDALAGEYEHSSSGVEAAFAEAAENRGVIGGMIIRVLTGSRLVKGAIVSALKTPLWLLASLLALTAALKRIRTYERRR